jgi:hypothetical protein
LGLRSWLANRLPRFDGGFDARSGESVEISDTPPA